MDKPLAKRLEAIKLRLKDRLIYLDSCRTEGEIEDFELRWGVRLPEEYRAFLLNVGDGGPGPPEYGMMRMGEVPNGYDESSQDVNAKLSREFPLTRYWVWENEPHPDKVLRAKVRQGGLILGHDGCGMYWVLIVTGAERGQMWEIAGEGAQPALLAEIF